MEEKAERRIYSLCIVCIVLVASSFIVPRFVSNPEGGFASGSSAVLTFLLMLAGSLLVSLYLAALTIQNYTSLRVTARIAGLVPGVLLGVLLTVLFGFLGY